MAKRLTKATARLNARRKAAAAVSDPQGRRAPGSMNAHKSLSIRSDRRR